jgi:hypothetical protein
MMAILISARVQTVVRKPGEMACPSRRCLSGLLFLAASLVQSADSQYPGFRVRRILNPVPSENIDGAAHRPQFTFARLVYRGGWGPNNWTTDSPKADATFVTGIKRMTNIEVTDSFCPVPLTSPEVFKYPFLYAVEVGYMQLSQQEADVLREYLVRGGFLVVDDFHGTLEWNNFEEQIHKAFPDCEIEELSLSHPIFHCFFDVEELIQIPGAQMLYTGRPYEHDGYDPHFRGIFDKNRRLMVMINFNSDLGDAWEWADVPFYPEKYSSAAYRLGINYVVYSMTH